MKHKTLYVVVTMLIAAGLACDLPGAATPDVTATFAVALTSAFATAQAAVGSPVPSNTPAPVPGTTQLAPATATPLTIPQATSVKPSDTPAPSNTPGVQGCSDDAQYVADVTIPDNTVLNPGQAFTKTWRIKNSGSCTWVGSYQFAFVADNQMSGPASVGISGNVAPGSQYDVSVNLVAPNTPGTYKSSWRMKNATGQTFGSTPFVQIVVAAPTATFTNTSLPASATATFTATVTATATNTAVPAGPFTVNINASNNGQVYSDGTIGNGVNNVGDVASNKSLQGFITFSLAGIPSGSTITAARLDLSSHDMLGNAFALGALRVYQHNYGTVDSSDYFTGSPLGALVRFESEAELSNPSKQAFDSSGLVLLQAALTSGQIQLRLQFNDTATNNDNADNALRPTPKLIVTYTTP